MLRRIGKGLWAFTVLLIFLVLAYLAFMTATDFRPEEETNLDIQNNRAEILKKGMPISVLTFNIGYCGLDAGEDFFMDGGRGSRCKSLEQTLTNLNHVTNFLTKEKPDLIMLQEVDIRSSRSHQVNELDHLQKNIVGYGSIFAVNYKVPWVPVPLARPMGSVYSGLLIFSRHNVKAATRYQFPGSEPWPRQLAELDRCFIESRLPLEEGKELLLINAHLSAYDKGGRIRKLQLAYLKKRIMAEFKNGNHVIVGADWNHGLPGSDPKFFNSAKPWPSWYATLPEDFTPPGFAWALDKTVPTVRNNASAYKEGENFVAVVDGFLVSANVKILRVTGHDLGFQNSDHNPVSAVFVLK
ncbi:MAG TPA: endonuclease/exonuclease/phosphatase family protein [Patescibacteria group bacterium]|nr:endonuclease/exonuclease/phosphatase family protein [Patescibacteria group bacterium]